MQNISMKTDPTVRGKICSRWML